MQIELGELLYLVSFIYKEPKLFFHCLTALFLGAYIYYGNYFLTHKCQSRKPAQQKHQKQLIL